MRKATTFAKTLLLLASSVCAAHGQQAAPPPASQTSQPASTQPTTNPLPSPARLLAFFRDAVQRGDEGLADAESCMNFSAIDEEVRRASGGEYVAKLAEILERLENEGLFDPAALPDDPTAPAQTIGKDPLLLMLEREDDRRWRFAETTVAALPDWHAALDESIAKLTAAVEPPVETPQTTPDEQPLSRLRSPYQMVEFFLIRVADAQNDTSAYVDAMSCLDFSEVAPEVVEERGPVYVDNLAAILAWLRSQGQFDRETLEEDPKPETDAVPIGRAPFSIIITRQSDQTWRFAAVTVKALPGMAEELARRREQAAQSGAAPAVADEPLRLDTSSPQATLNLYLTAMGDSDLELALTCFDLSRLDQAEKDIAGVLAGKLLLVLNRHKPVVFQEVPNDPEATQPYALLKHTAGRIEIDRQKRGDRAGEWLFTAATVNSIDRLYDEFESKPLLPQFKDERISFWALPSLYVREYVVPAQLKLPLLGLQRWQWIGLAVVFLLGLVTRRVCSWVLPPLSRRMLQSEGAAMLPQVARKALLPTSTLAMVVTFWGGLQLLDLGAAIMSWVWWGMRIVMTVVGVYASYRLIDLFMAYFTNLASRTSSRLDDVLVPLLQKTLKVVVAAIGFVVIANAFGFQIAPLLAGLGLGGFAFALAAQDSIKNLFGSVTVVLDRPFQVGDWVKIDDTEGTVESVGLRSSRVRTFYNSQVSIPNLDLLSARVDNMGRRRYRRISCKLGVTYSTTPEQLDAFCEGIRELVRLHPYTRKDYYLVWVNEFGASSIDILLYCFHETPDWTTELRERHRLLLDIMRLAKRLGVEFAFPTQTIHLEQPTPPTDGREQPPPKRDPTATEQESIDLGRKEAAHIVREQLGESIEKPPPYAFPDSR